MLTPPWAISFQTLASSACYYSNEFSFLLLLVFVCVVFLSVRVDSTMLSMNRFLADWPSPKAFGGSAWSKTDESISVWRDCWSSDYDYCYFTFFVFFSAALGFECSVSLTFFCSSAAMIAPPYPRTAGSSSSAGESAFIVE